MPFSQIFPPSPSPTESIRLFYHFGFFWRHQVCQFSCLQVWWSSQLFLDASSNGELTTFQDCLVSTQSVAWLCVLISVTHGPHEASVEPLT